MTTIQVTRDRSKASEHAIFLLREIRAPAPAVAAALPRIARNLNEHLAHASASHPLPVMLDVALSAADWRIAIDAYADDVPHRYFEGIVRLERSSTDVTQVVLLGRFIFPQASLYAGVGRNEAYDLAEEDLIQVFDALLREIQTAIAVPAGATMPSQHPMAG